MAADLPPISVVVIGRNEGERLLSCLESVLAAEYPTEKIELIYVDTDSTDDSCAAAEMLGAKVVHIKPERPTAAAARNAGLHAANHDLIHFLDGDTIVERTWFNKAVDALVDPDIACVFGRREEIEPNATVYNFWMHHDWYLPPGPSEYCGGDSLFRRDVLRRLGGYDDRLIAGEERDLSYRLFRDEGRTILHLGEPMTAHNINMTRFREYWVRCARAGYAYAEVSSRYPGLRSWRRICHRNLAHSVAVATTMVLTGALWLLWPLIIWTVLVVLAIVRNALRCRSRVGSIGGALLYSFHHYLSKIPTVAGQLEYYLRRFLRAGPKGLVEYRDEVKGRSDGYV